MKFVPSGLSFKTWKMKMTARIGFSTEDFAGGVWVICCPSFRLSPALSTSVPFLKTCKFSSWLSFGVDLAPFLFYSLSANFSSACPPVAGPVGQNMVLGLARTLWVLVREIKAAASRQKSIRSHSPGQREGHAVLWGSFITDLEWFILIVNKHSE